MPASDGYRPRTFIKVGPDGEPIERLVSTPSEEVDALFDGYVEQGPLPAKRVGSASAGTAKRADTSP